MRVLLFHNKYRQPGGEDAVVASEAQLLRSAGIDVHEVLFDNDGPEVHGLLGQIRVAHLSAWSDPSYEKVRTICQTLRPDLAHVHNFWMTLSPSVHAACRAEGVPTVQTLHNFRLFCANGLLMRNGSVCEDCLGKEPWRGLVRRCYRQSWAASATVVRMISTNRRRQTWNNDVSAYIALTNFSRAKCIEGGLDPGSIFVKPNFVEDPGASDVPPSRSHRILFVGRLSSEKGVETLLRAWQRSEVRNRFSLRIVGSGPDEHRLKTAAGATEGVEFAGSLPAERVWHEMRHCRMLVMPSVWYESFGRVLIEAFACGRGAVVSDLGAMREIVAHDRTGLTCTAGSSDDLASALDATRSDSLVDRLGQAARTEYLSRYTPERNLRRLLAIYEHVTANGKRSEV